MHATEWTDDSLDAQECSRHSLIALHNRLVIPKKAGNLPLLLHGLLVLDPLLLLLPQHAQLHLRAGTTPK